MSELAEPPPEAEAIDRAGVYDIAHSRYLADPVAMPSLNASVLKVLINQSPAHARAAHPRFNPGCIEEAASAAQDVGTAAHAIFLHGENNVELVNVENWRTKDAKAAKAAIEAEGRIALKKSAYLAVHHMVDVLQRFRDATGAFTDGLPERTLIWHENGPVWCRAKLDWLPNDPGAPLWDLKTTSTHATIAKWLRPAFDLGADVQASFYCRGAETIFGEPPEAMNFAVIENTPPHGIGVFSFSRSAIEVGDAKVNYGLRIWHACMTANEWPTYAIERQFVDPPSWVLREWEHLTASGAAMHERNQAVASAGNLAERIIETGSFGA